MRRTGLAFLAALVLSGCASAGFHAAGNLTEVQLAEPNYRLIATGVTGRAEAGYLLGVSVPVGPAVQTLAVARVSGSGELYGEALADLWANFERTHGAIAGRRLALVNIRFDSDAMNLLLYTQPRVAVRADVVEFVD